LPPIHFDFIDSDNVNACAFVYKGQRFVGVTTGAAMAIGLLFERMLSDRRILPTVGNPQKGVEHPPLAQPLRQSLIQNNRTNGPNLIEDEGRHSVWWPLCQLAFTFLVFHEITHIRDGHVDYLDSRRGSPFLAELGWVPGTTDESIEMQAIEADADRQASAIAASLACQWAKNPPLDNPYLQDIEQHLFVWLFAIFSFFRLFDDEPIATTGLFNRSHPPLRLRLRLVCEVFMQMVEANGGIASSQILPVMSAAIAEAEEAFFLLTGERPDPGTTFETSRYTEAFQPEADEHNRRLNRCWQRSLRAALEPYAFSPLAAFADHLL
jgi:hypothetical protein